MQTFIEKNYINGYFKTSAKKNKNINESIEFVIKKIIERTKDFEERDGIYETERKTIILTPVKPVVEEKKKDNEVKKNYSSDDENDSSCCC